MGIGMQIVYLGFAGSSEFEAEAAAQLVCLERFSGVLAGCHLAIEALPGTPDERPYDVRLDLITRSGELRPVEHYTDRDVRRALRRAFAAGERMLREPPAAPDVEVRQAVGPHA